MKLALTLLALAGIAVGQSEPVLMREPFAGQRLSCRVLPSGDCAFFWMAESRPRLLDLLPLPEPLPPVKGTSGQIPYCMNCPTDPADIPAIQVRDMFSPVGACGDGQKPEVPLWNGCLIPWWTCADKSRVLLTAEDGSHWCHRVQP